jgi:MFS family permease
LRALGRDNRIDGMAGGSIVRSLRHRNYQLFFAGQLVSLIGTWMQSVAQAWLVYRLTGSAVLLGAIGFANQVPVLLVAPFGGAVADRYARRRILLCTQTAAMLLALALGVLTLRGLATVPTLFVFSGALGVINAFDIPTRQAFVVEMVGTEDLVNAIALNSSMVNGARLVGPAIAGLVVATVGEGWCFVGNGVSFVAVLAGLLAMRVRTAARTRKRGSALRDIVEGVRFAAGSPPLRALLLLIGFVCMVAMPYAVLMPVFADRVLRHGASGLGILMGASGAGALIGAIGLAARRQLRGIGRWIAAGTIAFGVSLFGFGLSQSFWWSVALLVPAGAAMMLLMAGSNTLIQTLTPDAMRGRVMALYVMVFMGTAPFGGLLAGLAADRVGASTTVAVGGALCVVAGLVFSIRLPRLRKVTRAIIAQQLASGEPPEELG